MSVYTVGSIYSTFATQCKKDAECNVVSEGSITSRRHVVGTTQREHTA